MGQIKKQYQLKVSAQKLWDIWKDVEKTPEWVEGVQESAITSAAREGLDLTWRENCLFGSLPVQMDHRITQWQPAQKTVVSTQLPMGGTMQRITEFKASDESCEIDVQLDWNLGMASAFIGEEKVEEMMEKNLDRTLQKWESQAL